MYKPNYFPGPGVINLSKKELTKEQKEILERGIKFGLNPKNVPIEEIISKIETGIHKFPKDINNVDELRLRVVNILTDFGSYQEKVKNKDIKILKDLKQDDSLIITRADKSNTVVILEKDDYDSKIETILSDTSTYKKLNSDPTDLYAKRLRKDLEDLKTNGSITPQMYHKFFPRGSVSPRIYGLPKIHKTGIPLRPIVSTTNSPTVKIEKWAAMTLKPLLYLQNSYIKNSKFLKDKLISVEISEESRLFSFDIKSMYTYIPFDKSFSILSKKLEERKNEIEELPSGIELETILNLVKITSRYTNYFKFRDNFYHQIRGLAMGGPLSPLLANIYVEYVENLAIETYFLKPKFWGRYMDDILVIWNYGESEIEGFLEHLNNLGGELIFTIEKETENKLPFLDILIHRNNNELAFSIYRKPTSNNRYLSFTSNHPIQVKRGVVISLVDRVLKLASPEYISNELIFIKDILVGNGYPENMISQIIEKRKKKVDGTKNIRRRWVKSRNKLHNFAFYPNIITKIKERIKKT